MYLYLTNFPYKNVEEFVSIPSPKMPGRVNKRDTFLTAIGSWPNTDKHAPTKIQILLYCYAMLCYATQAAGRRSTVYIYISTRCGNTRALISQQGGDCTQREFVDRQTDRQIDHAATQPARRPYYSSK